MANKNILQLDIYEDEDLEVLKRTATGLTTRISFGTIRKLAQLFEAADANDSAAVLAAVGGSWQRVIHILEKAFPDITEEEWDCVAVADVVKVLLQIMTSMSSAVKAIPTSGDEKN